MDIINGFLLIFKFLDNLAEDFNFLLILIMHIFVITLNIFILRSTTVMIIIVTGIRIRGLSSALLANFAPITSIFRFGSVRQDAYVVGEAFFDLLVLLLLLLLLLSLFHFLEERDVDVPGLSWDCLREWS